MSNLSAKFIKGLKNYNLSQEDIVTQNFKYCGGNAGCHHNYFKIFFKNELKKNSNMMMPALKDACICGHQISDNCYIINDSQRILTLGNCCIKRFVPKSGRTCEICGEPHRNRIINKCNLCRIGFCDKCNKECNKKYKLCWDCFNNESNYSDSDEIISDDSENSDNLEENLTKINHSSDKIINFGKYKGQKYKNIMITDSKYLNWLSIQEWCKDKDYIKQILSEK